MVPEGDSSELAWVTPQFQIARSQTGSSLSTICKSARGELESVNVSVSAADIRAAAESRLRAPCNPSTPRGIQARRRHDVLPGTPLALRTAEGCRAGSAGEGCEIWLERSFTYDTNSQLIRSTPDQNRVDELIAACSLLSNDADFCARDAWALGASVTYAQRGSAAGSQGRLHRSGPSISCASIKPPPSLQILPLRHESPCRTPADTSLSRESFVTMDPRPSRPSTVPADEGLQPRPSGHGASSLMQASMNIRQGFWEVLGMVRSAACCSGVPVEYMPAHCVAGRCVPGQCIPEEQCVNLTAHPAVCERDRRRSIGEFVVVGRSDSTPSPSAEEEGFIPECWARVEECSKADGALSHWKDYHCDLHAEAQGSAFWDDEVVVSTNQSSPLPLSAAGLQKQLRRGGA